MNNKIKIKKKKVHRRVWRCGSSSRALSSHKCEKKKRKNPSQKKKSW
jgi:hypothetical protein